jgi:hypothetical protein
MTILIIRHAEKPEQGPHLSDIGTRRADALIALFRTCFRKPDKLIAAADSAKSSRPRETLEPMSRAFNLPIDASTLDVNVVAERLRDDPAGSLILISWRHQSLPALARALGASDVPAAWPTDIYDRIWRLMPVADGALRLADLPMALMPGDTLGDSPLTLRSIARRVLTGAR